MPPHSACSPRHPLLHRGEGGATPLLSREGAGEGLPDQATTASSAKIGEPHLVSLRAGIDKSAPHPGRRIIQPRGPCIVIGHDARTSSPDLTVGLAAALRRMECDVVDIGRVSRPSLDFAVQHLHADGGVYVGGQGCAPAWNGLEFVGSGGDQWCRPGKLDEVAERFESGTVRPSRRAGRQRYFDISTPYRASFWKHVHDLPATKLVLSCCDAVIEATVSAIFAEVPVDLVPIDVPINVGRRWIDAAMVTTIRQSRADLGVLIEPDGQTCLFWDEQGSPLADCALPRAMVTSAGVSSRQEINNGGDAILTLLHVLQMLPRADGSAGGAPRM